jgi:hypothetical protein
MGVLVMIAAQPPNPSILQSLVPSPLSSLRSSLSPLTSHAVAAPAVQAVIYPATALAAVVYGLARYSCPGPDRPGKFRLMALMVTVSGA